jgi:hypothetical protein
MKIFNLLLMRVHTKRIFLQRIMSTHQHVEEKVSSTFLWNLTTTSPCPSVELVNKTYQNVDEKLISCYKMTKLIATLLTVKNIHPYQRLEPILNLEHHF